MKRKYILKNPIDVKNQNFHENNNINELTNNFLEVSINQNESSNETNFMEEKELNQNIVIFMQRKLNFPHPKDFTPTFPNRQMVVILMQNGKEILPGAPYPNPGLHSFNVHTNNYEKIQSEVF